MTPILMAAALWLIIGGLYYWAKKGPGRERAPTFPMVAVDPLVPDKPVGFGYKCVWMAVAGADPQRLADHLSVPNAASCNWQEGVRQAYDDAVFITPTVDGWTLACGWGLPCADVPEEIMRVKKILSLLSGTFGEAQYFCTHRVVGYHCWMRAVGGRVTRVYVSEEAEAKPEAIEGVPTGIEKELGDEEMLHPDEETVMKVAGAWSVDPTALENRTDIGPSLGLLGRPGR